MWIEAKERLPERFASCWVYGFLEHVGAKLVFQAGFNDRVCYSINRGPYEVGPGWEFDAGTECVVPLCRVSHWMPYFTPEPTEDKK